MSTSNFSPITPEQLYNGLIDDPGKEIRKRVEYIRENKVCENNYMNMFGNMVRTYGKCDAKDYAKMLGVNVKYFDGAITLYVGYERSQLDKQIPVPGGVRFGRTYRFYV